MLYVRTLTAVDTSPSKVFLACGLSPNDNNTYTQINRAYHRYRYIVL